MLHLNNLTLSFGRQEILNAVNLHVSPKQRIGLIGRNGTGKSSLLKVILGELDADSGDITRAPGIKINCLTQEPRLTPGNTLEAELKSVFAEVNALYEEETRLLTAIESKTGDEQMKALHRLDVVHNELHRLDAASIDARISRMVTGLGFSLDELGKVVDHFSGGWKMRVNLAKVLLEGADLLLLDEPTNHLDLDATQWLESFLSDYPGALIIVSHDRRFLDRVVTDIVELEFHTLTVWPGTYSQFLVSKADAVERQVAAADRQGKELAKQTAFVERFRASATKSTQAKSREKQLAKIERIDAPKTDNRRMTFTFPTPKASGKQVFTLRNLAKSYGANQLFTNLSADIQYHQRIFILGPNGCGKTTLLKLLMDIEPADSGEVRPGHNVTCGYFSQHQLATLDAKKSPFDTIQDARPLMSNTEVRNLLARFLVTGDDVFKPLDVMSGGEKSKVALAKLLLEAPNTLLLDEPTNHMDIPAKEVLEGALSEFEGTMLCVSHDRYFISALATDIWELYNGQLLCYHGNYDYYLETRDAVRARYAPDKPGTIAPTSPEAPEPKTPPGHDLRERKQWQKELNQVEKRIVDLEAKIAKLDTEINHASNTGDFDQVTQLSEALGQLHETLNQENTLWESLAEKLS